MSEERVPAFSKEARDAFRQMLHHKVAMWEAAHRFEMASGWEIETDTADFLVTMYDSAGDLLKCDDVEISELLRAWVDHQKTAVAAE
jgi:hypothetical protein